MITERVPPTKRGYFGDTNMHGKRFGKQRRAWHSCERCGFERLVKVTPYLVHADHTDVMGLRHDLDGEPYIEVGGSCSALCTACAYEANADWYEHLAAKNRKRAVEARSRQALRRLKPFKTT